MLTQKPRNWFVFFIAFIFNISFVSAQNHSSSVKTVKAGYFYFPGYHEIINDEKNSYGSGYGFEFYKLLRRYSDLNFEYTGYDKTIFEVVEMLDKGEIDLYTPAYKDESFNKNFIFSKSIGRSYTEISVREDDNRFRSNEFSSFNGMIIGAVNKYHFHKDLKVFAEEKGFSYVLKLFDSEREMMSSLHDGVIDGIVYGSLRKHTGDKMIARFEPEDYYVAVRKSDVELLAEINYGIEQMNINEEMWQNTFYNNYFRKNNETHRELIFSSREKKYIEDVKAGRKRITACAQIDRNPYSWVEDEKLVGIIPEYLNYLMSMADLPYELIYEKNRSQNQYWNMSDSIDVYLDARASDSSVMISSVGVETDSYMKLSVSRVMRRNFSGKVKKVAVTDNQSLKGIDDELITADVQMITCENREEAMKAVKKGKADVCYIYSYMAEKFVNNDPDGELVFNTMKANAYDMYYYVNSETDHELVSILNKCIKADQSDTLENIINKYARVEQSKITFIQFAKNNPLLISLALFVFVLLIGIAFLQSYNSEKVRRVNIELENSVKREKYANAAKTEFLNNMSHDIRTPMNAIIGYSSLAITRLDNKELVYDYLKKISTSGSHLLSLINDVLDMSRIESGQIKI